MNRTQADFNTYFRLELMGHLLTDARWDGFVHEHAFTELIYVMGGKVDLCLDGQEISVVNGQVLLVPAQHSHKITAARPSSFVYIGFQTNLADVSEFYLQPLNVYQTPQLQLLTEGLDDIANRVFERRAELSDFAPQLPELLLPALCSLASSAGQQQDPKQILVDKVKHYIKHNYHKPIRVDEIAAGLYHSPHYLGNVFAAVTGMTIKEYTLQIKMQKALWQLQNSHHSVGDIAGMLGYDSTHYFSKCFKQYFGFSPSKIRQGA